MKAQAATPSRDQGKPLSHQAQVFQSLEESLKAGDVVGPHLDPVDSVEPRVSAVLRALYKHSILKNYVRGDQGYQGEALD